MRGYRESQKNTRHYRWVLLDKGGYNWLQGLLGIITSRVILYILVLFSFFYILFTKHFVFNF